MAPPKRPWFRFYVEALTDPKLRRLTPDQRWVWVAVLGAARQSCDPGRLMLTTDIPMEIIDLAELAGVAQRKASDAIVAMTRLGLVVMEDGAMTVPAWNARQYESDDSTPRSQKHRNGVDATTMQRPIAVDATPPETETETDNNFVRDQPPTDEGFEEFWEAYPRKEGRKIAHTRWKNLTKSDRAAALEALPTHVRSWRNEGRQQKYIKQPGAWINGRHWEDEITPARRGLRAVGAGGVDVENAT